MTEYGFKNQILSNFSPEAKKRFIPIAMFAHFDPGEAATEKVGDLLFIESGSVSMFATQVGSQSFEIMSIGNEGMVGAEQIFCKPTSGPMLWTTEGAAWIVSQVAFWRLAEEFPEVKRLTSVYMGVFLNQLFRQTLCLRKHPSDERIVTAFLNAYDRCGSPFFMTQESLGRRLDVSRTFINAVAGKLTDQGAIRYKRGKIEILDKALLERQCCPCYKAGQDDRLQLATANDHVVNFEKREPENRASLV